MQLFYILTERDKLHLFTKEGDKFQRQFIDGEPFFPYEINKLNGVNNEKGQADILLDSLTEEYNLMSKTEIEFIIIDNHDAICSEAVIKAFKKNIKEIKSINDILTKILFMLNKDEKLYTDEYGVNFDGINYMLRNGKLKENKFSLLGFTLKEDKLMNFTD